MWPFKERTEEKSAGETKIEGQALHVNPSPDVSLSRKKARLKTVKKVLEQNTIHPSRKRHFEKAQRRLELEIKLAEGDY